MDVGCGRQAGPLRPDYGAGWADLACDRCGATWVGVIDDPCEWCQRSLERLIADQRNQLLNPPWLHNQTAGDGTALTWAARLRRAVDTGLITDREARNAIAKASNAT